MVSLRRSPSCPIGFPEQTLEPRWLRQAFCGANRNRRRLQFGPAPGNLVAAGAASLCSLDGCQTTGSRLEFMVGVGAGSPVKAWLSLQDRPSFAGMAGVLAQAPRVPSRKHEANGIASKRWRSFRIRPSLRGHLPVAPPGFADTPWSELAAERQAARLSAAAASGQQKSQAAKDVIPGANLAMQCIDARPDPYPAAAGCRNETWLARVEISRARLRPT